MITFVNPMQFIKAASPIAVTPSGIVILVSFGQELKVFVSISAMLFGRFMLDRCKQFEKAWFPILFTLSGMVMPVGLSQL